MPGDIMEFGVDQIRVHHCRLRLRRTGGWSWGADPKQLVRMATRALPQLLARELSRLLAGRNEDLTIQRLAIQVPVYWRQLIEADPVSDGFRANAELSQRIARHLKQALAIQTGMDPDVSAEDQSPGQDATAAEDLRPADRPGKDAIDLLTSWYGQGRLIRLLNYFSEGAMAAWEKLICNSLRPAVRPSEDGQPDHYMEAREFSQAVCQSMGQLKPGGSQRLVLLAALLQRYPKHFTPRQLTQLLDEAVPASGVPMDSLAPLPENPDQVTPADKAAQTAMSHRRRPSDGRSGQVAGKAKHPPSGDLEVKVPSVLPFVAMGVLARLEYFDVLSAALKAGSMETDMGYFAVSLAYKMLPGPQRGWHRQQSERLAAAAAGGFNREVSGEELDRFAGDCLNSLSPADGYLKLLLTEGHDPSCALLIHRLTAAGAPVWLLLDSQGCFPMGWFLEPAALLEALGPFGGNTLLISEAASDNDLLAALDHRRYRFVTPLTPARQDAWRPVDRKRRWWTNDLDVQTGWLLHQCRDLQTLTESAQRISRALIDDRPALLPVKQGPAVRFEQSLALAAGSALATIAWQLWGRTESTDPVLAIDRLGDWEGRVQFERRKITVRPAVGRRYLDLYHQNFFADVAHIPWFRGRRMEFAGL